MLPRDRHIIIVGIIAASLSIFILYTKRTHANVSKRFPVATKYNCNDYVFNESNAIFNMTENIFLFHNVCVVSCTTSNASNPELRDIVVYDNNLHLNGTHTMSVVGNILKQITNWNLIFKTESVPKGKRMLKNAAFFVVPTGHPWHFYHFYTDEFEGLYSVIRLANKMNSCAKNHIAYLTHSPPSGSRQKFETLLWTLNAEKYYDLFYNIEPNTCFSIGVFGTRLLFDARHITDHVLKFFKLAPAYNEIPYVTIVQRHARIIVNIQELFSAVKFAGFSNVRIVYFEDLHMLDQVRIAATSAILIGIHGAGLQWSMFMRPNSYLMEISWPRKYWPFYFSDRMSQYKIQTRRIEAIDVRVNWTSFSKKMRGGRTVSEEEKTRLLQNPGPYFLWKWADAVVPINETIHTLSKLKG